MRAITTHVLDTARGRPAEGIPVLLERETAEKTWQIVGNGFTDPNGRVNNIVPHAAKLEEGIYRLTFATSVYFAAQSAKGFYPHVVISFYVTDPAEHYHVALTLSRFGYTTYRGS